MTACVREEDLVARPGGDEFMIVATRTANDRGIATLAQRLIDSLSEPFDLEGHEVFVSGSVGVAVSEHGGGTPEELLREPRRREYCAKELGRSLFRAVRFDPPRPVDGEDGDRG